jgi:hypothetical protein
MLGTASFIMATKKNLTTEDTESHRVQGKELSSVNLCALCG